jgi:hypothetical protein
MSDKIGRGDRSKLYFIPDHRPLESFSKEALIEQVLFLEEEINSLNSQLKTMHDYIRKLERRSDATRL